MELIEIVISIEGHANFCIEDGRYTALTYACAGGKRECVRYLIDRGADLHLSPSLQGWPPFWIACHHNQWQIALDLLNAGANPTLCPKVRASEINIIEKVCHSKLPPEEKIAFLKALFKKFPAALKLLDQPLEGFLDNLMGYLVNLNQNPENPTIVGLNGASVFEILIWMGFQNVAPILANMTDYQIALEINKLTNRPGVTEDHIRTYLHGFFEIDPAHYLIKSIIHEWGMVDGIELKNDFMHLLEALPPAMTEEEVKASKETLGAFVDRIFRKDVPASPALQGSTPLIELYAQLRPDITLKKISEMIGRLKDKQEQTAQLKRLCTLQTLDDLQTFRLDLLHHQLFNLLKEVQGGVWMRLQHALKVHCKIYLNWLVNANCHQENPTIL